MKTKKLNNDLNEILLIFMHIYMEAIRKTLEKFNLYKGQPQILLSLCVENGVTQKELLKGRNIKPSTISVSIKRMSKEGLIEKKEDINDKRVTRIYITEKGKKIVRAFYKEYQKLKENSFKNISNEEKEIFYKILEKMIYNIEENNSIKSSRSCEIKKHVKNLEFKLMSIGIGGE